jgi:GT2 family glycosyltransferase
MDVSVLIVNYNTCDLTLQCIRSIIDKTNNIDFEIIVIDNASVDGSQQKIKEIFPDITFIENKFNLGFGTANNLGAKEAKGKYLFFLNSDCLLIENSLKNFYNFMEINNIDRTIGVVSALLYDINMNLNMSFHPFPSISNWFKGIKIKFLKNVAKKKEYDYLQSQTNINVDAISGAALFIFKPIFDELKGFDEQFFLYFEETDLQKRMSTIGLKRIILKNQKIIHLEGYSSKTVIPNLKSTIIFTDSMFKYYKKYFFFPSFFILCIINIPFLIYPLLSLKYSVKEKKNYIKVLLRKNIEENKL